MMSVEDLILRIESLYSTYFMFYKCDILYIRNTHYSILISFLYTKIALVLLKIL